MVPDFSPGPIGAICALAADFDQNGYDDLVLCERHGHSKLFFNIKGQMSDQTTNLGIGNRPGLFWTDARALDLNNDGRTDLVYADGQARIKLHYLNADNVFGKADRIISLKPLILSKTETQSPSPSQGQIKFDFFHADDDDSLDLLVGTNLVLQTTLEKYLGNFVILCPDFKRVTPLGPVNFGTGHVKRYDRDAVVIAHAAPGVHGETELLKKEK